MKQPNRPTQEERIAAAAAAMRAPVEKRDVGDLEYPRQFRSTKQRVQSQKELADQARATEAADAAGVEDDICPTCGDLRSRCTGDDPEDDCTDRASRPVLCLTCGGEVFLLGQLGNRLHARCRYCGLDQSLEVS